MGWFILSQVGPLWMQGFASCRVTRNLGHGVVQGAFKGTDGDARDPDQNHQSQCWCHPASAEGPAQGEVWGAAASLLSPWVQWQWGDG